MGTGEHAQCGKLKAVRQIARRLAAGRDPLIEPRDPMLGGLSVIAWWALYWQCHEVGGVGTIHRVEWPDGGALAEQPTLVVTMFDELHLMVAREMSSKTHGK